MSRLKPSNEQILFSIKKARCILMPHVERVEKREREKIIQELVFCTILQRYISISWYKLINFCFYFKKISEFTGLFSC